MTKHPTLGLRRLLFILAGLTMTLAVAFPFAAQQGLPPFDEAQMVADLTGQLQLNQEQAERLREVVAAHRPKFERLLDQARGIPGNKANPNELRTAYDRERRAMAEELMPALAPEQQARLRYILAATMLTPPGSPIAPLKPKLSDTPLAASEHLISLAATATRPQTRSRRASATQAALTEDQKILHLLNRAGFGPRPGDMERVRQIGLERYLDEQLHPEGIPDEFLAAPLLALSTLQMSTPEIVQAYTPPPLPRPLTTPTPAAKPQAVTAPPSKAEGEAKPDQENKAKKDETKVMQPPADAAAQDPGKKVAPRPIPQRDPQQPLRELQQAKLLRAAFSERQLQEVMTDFWSNHFNVFAGKDADRWLLTSYERDVIRPYALGKFKELLVATAQSPAMLYYLDNFLSQAEMPPRPGAQPPAQPQPRRPGLNENYARELMELHTLGVDGGYTQKDVTEVARCFTGWSLLPQPNPSFVFRLRTHDRGEKTVLGLRLLAGGGIDDGLRVLDLLAHHPSTARFISRKLCQRFVADEPPANLVERAANVFLKTDGDIREVVRTILTSPEFYSPKYYRAKVKSPFEVVASALRATAATTDGAQPLIQWIARLGEPLYLCVPPTGYSEESARWINTGTLIERMNFAVAFVGNRVNGTKIDVNKFLNAEAPVDQEETLNRLLALLVHSDVSAETRASLGRILAESQSQVMPAKFDDRATRKNTEPQLSGLTALIIGSRDFQVK